MTRDTAAVLGKEDDHLFNLIRHHHRINCFPCCEQFVIYPYTTSLRYPSIFYHIYALRGGVLSSPNEPFVVSQNARPVERYLWDIKNETHT